MIVHDKKLTTGALDGSTNLSRLLESISTKNEGLPLIDPSIRSKYQNGPKQPNALADPILGRFGKIPQPLDAAASALDGAGPRLSGGFQDIYFNADRELDRVRGCNKDIINRMFHYGSRGFSDIYKDYDGIVFSAHS